MSNSKTFAGTALAAIVALGTLSTTDAAAESKGMEKCYGIAKTGMNDCGTSSHSCAGQAKADSDEHEWVFVPKGTCDKIVGGHTVSDMDKDEGHDH